MASYTAHCAKCDTLIDFYRRIDDRDNTPECCGASTTRLIAAPMIPQMGLADHYKIVTGSGQVCYGKHDYQKYLDKNGLVPQSEIKGEAQYQRAESEKKRRSEVRKDVIKAVTGTN